MKIQTRGAKDKKSLCNTYRNMGVSITKPTLDEWAMARVCREAVKKYRLTTATISDVNDFIEEEMFKIPSISTFTTERQIEQAKAMVERYLVFDDRRLMDAYPADITFESETLRVKPDYWISSSEKTPYFEEEVDVVEIITVSAGRPSYGDTTRSKGESSVYHNLETLGNLLYGKTYIKGRKGVVRVIYDSLKTSYDKGGDYSKPFSAAIPGKFTKSGDNNRLIFEVPFDENGEIISAYNRRLEKLMENYKNSLNAYNTGICEEEVSKGTCEACEYYDRCKGYSKRPEPKSSDVKTTKPMTRDDFDISSEQEKVIGAREGIYCVDAGPGSGKTFSVALRIADMIVEGASPEDFLLLSFSKAAVKVLRERVEYFLNEVYQMAVDVSSMAIATFHSLANDVVIDNYKLLGFTSEPQLIDDVESIDLVRQSIDWSDPIDGFDYTNPLMKFGAGGVVPNLYKLFTEIKAFNMSKAEFEKTYGDRYKGVTDKIWETYERFQSLMVSGNFIDYSDMEILVEKLIEANPNLITDKYNYKHIIVDEFQDSNDFQMLFVNTLSIAPDFISLMVIGDEAQAIYGFRGTSPENFIHFDDKMGLDDVEDLTLTINRRSTPEIVELSNQIIALNRSNSKVMVSANKSIGQDVRFNDFEVGSAELPWIAKEIKELVSKGINPSDIAFISHKKSTLTRLQGLLSEEGILALYDQPEELLSDSKVKAVISLAMFLRDFSATKGVFDYLCELIGNSFIKKANAQEIIDAEVEEVVSIFTNYSDRDKKECLMNLIKGLQDGDTLYDSFVERLEGKTNYTYFQLLDYIYKFYKYESSATAEPGEEYEAVALVTAHSSKGKEWKHVFVSLSDFDSGNLTRAEMPEKIRLTYVACTRAEEELTVTCSKYRKTEGDTKPINRFWRCFSILPGAVKVKAS